MPRFRCLECTVPAMTHEGVRLEQFAFESDTGVCPRCTAGPPLTVLLVDVHFLVPAADGQILGKGRRFAVACNRKRSHLATGQGDNYAASGDVRAVSCPRCKESPEYQAMAAILPEASLLRAIEAAQRDAGGCC